ncbi:MAG: elongation factor P [Candidatus Marinimicrobia bacterium]|jgi:elongation factor P|nr:elongation factor P [Candidatus Neomarinimicrobiota bacterium]MBT3632559.1 elongation factor P [Candidatus Neomarinimicrobiota bacterium]MBT3824958.1 elongation factor P [Candidatus Neomarinimicrobiota bacterium]MBT4129118.1 elongation factor P [Candidatus Neomarinimicrobiota bacterium]MBT4295251.1 elongation factor P [Candidatus Neomarinimicrobiota bacterium]
MASTSDIKNNLVMEFNGNLWKVVEFLHVKPGKGNAFVRTKLKKIPGGQVIEQTFRSGEKIADVKLMANEMTYLYSDESHYHIMDNETYEQIAIDADLMVSVKDFLKENDIIKVLFRDATPVDVEVAAHVILEIKETDPGLRGDTATGGSKPAFLETGLKVTVPLFLNIGDKVKVDTRTGDYLERVRA